MSLYTFAHGTGVEGDPYQIWTPADFEGIFTDDGMGNFNHMGKHYVQKADLDLTGHQGLGKIFELGVYDGGGFKITGLTDFFFEKLKGATLKNLIFIDPTVIDTRGGVYGAGLIDHCLNSGSTVPRVENVKIFGGFFSGNDWVGALISYASKCIIHRCSVFNAEVRCGEDGGLLLGGVSECTVSECLAAQGLVTNKEGMPGNIVGGLIGNICMSDLYRCGADVEVSGNNYAGGLGGSFYDGGTIEDCFALGNVSGRDVVGGFIGFASYGTIQKCLSAGSVSTSLIETIYVGGFVGKNGSYPEEDWDIASILNCFYDFDVSGFNDSDPEAFPFKGTPKTTAEMKTQATFTNFDFTTKWAIGAGWFTGDVKAASGVDGTFGFSAEDGELVLAIDHNPNNGYPFLRFENIQTIQHEGASEVTFYVRN